MNVSYLCVSLLALLVIGGGFYVSVCRGRSQIVQGYPDDPSHYLHKSIRAHGNTVEYAPVIALLIYAIGQLNPPAWILGCMVAITVARYSIYFGLILSPTLDKPHPLRFLGALFTYILGFVLCGYLFYQAVCAG